MPTPADAISTYLHAKDGNRPFSMRRAFTATAALEMIVKTDAIAFPATAQGLDAITGILVHRFAREFENIYSFCLASPPKPDLRQFSCDWLVGMSSRDGGAVRVGCGRYDWYFQPDAGGLVERLRITIERMQVFSSDSLIPIMDWLADLPYPWCRPGDALAAMPQLPGLVEIAAHIGKILGSGGIGSLRRRPV